MKLDSRGTQSHLQAQAFDSIIVFAILLELSSSTITRTLGIWKDKMLKSRQVWHFNVQLELQLTHNDNGQLG